MPVQEQIASLDVSLIDEQITLILDYKSECVNHSCTVCQLNKKLADCKISKFYLSPEIYMSIMLGELNPFGIFTMGFLIALNYMEAKGMETLFNA